MVLKRILVLLNLEFLLIQVVNVQKNCVQDIVEKQAPGLMKEAEKFLILSNIDRLWKEHLQALKFVQQAVGLRGYAQRDPLIEYKLEGYNLFLDMMAQIRRNVIYSIYQVRTITISGNNTRDSYYHLSVSIFYWFSFSVFV